MKKLSQPSKRKYGFITMTSKLGTLVSSLVLFTTIILLILTFSGCAGAMVDALNKSRATGKTYAKVEKTFPALPADHGRLFIYRTPESTHTSLYMLSGLTKNPSLYTVDDAVHSLFWEAFVYFDLPEGQHEIACGNYVSQKKNFWTSKLIYQKSTNIIQISVSNASDVFVRFDSIKESPFFQPVLVECEQARAEIIKLPHQTVY